MRLPASRTLSQRPRLYYPILWVYRRMGQRRLVQVRGTRFFWSSSTTTDSTASSEDSFPDDDFFMNINNLLAAWVTTSTQTMLFRLYRMWSCLFSLRVLEFLVLAMRLNAISCLDVIYSSSILVCMISLIFGFIIMLIYCLFGLNYIIIFLYI
jgi:hypothetical protein